MEKIVTHTISTYNIDHDTDLRAVVNHIINGDVVLLKVGGVYSFIINPYIKDLLSKFNIIKQRKANQVLSVVACYASIQKIIDKTRINPDYYILPENLSSKFIFRVPIIKNDYPFSYHNTNNTLQYITFDHGNLYRKKLLELLNEKGIEFLSITSGNVSGAPTVTEDLDALELAVVFNEYAHMLDIDLKTVVALNKTDTYDHKGSYLIIDFSKPENVEIKRYINKDDIKTTHEFLEKYHIGKNFSTPLIINID